jgi:hypothetical protein
MIAPQRNAGDASMGRPSAMKVLFALLDIAVALSCCGGSGSAVTAPASSGVAPATQGGNPAAASAPAGPITSTLHFPLQSAFEQFAANGSSTSYSLWWTWTTTSGYSMSCSGTALIDWAVPVAASFGSVTTGLSIATKVTSTLGYPCGTTNYVLNGMTYYDANYDAIGDATPGYFGLYQPTLAYPAAVSVNDHGTLATETYWTDDTMTTLLYTVTCSYAIEPEAADTAIVNLIFDSTYTSGQTENTQVRYRIAATGPLVPVSIDDVIQLGSPNGIMSYRYVH